MRLVYVVKSDLQEQAGSGIVWRRIQWFFCEEVGEPGSGHRPGTS